jgi:murein L,D-transpeptidase YcbB/YkuD
VLWNAVDGFQIYHKSKELIAINIPAYQLTYFRNGKPELGLIFVVEK